MSRKPTMEDVKNLAGVSISTVSRVINGTKKVSPDKVIAVNKAIEKLGYKPNELARSLVMKRSNTLGIILDDIGIEYMAQYVRGIDEVGKMYKYDILLYSTFGNLDVQKAAVEFLSSKQVEGIIIISEKINNEILYLIREYDIPYILLDKYYDTRENNTVTFDYEEAMKSMTNYHLEAGHDNILYLGVKSHDYSDDQKQNGFESAIKESGKNLFVANIEKDNIDFAYNYLVDNIKYIYDNKITSIVASSDKLALGVEHYCYDHGIKIPDDLSISGFGNSYYTTLVRPSISTIRLPYYDVGAVTVRMLIKVLRDEVEFKESINLNYELMVRDTIKINKA